MSVTWLIHMSSLVESCSTPDSFICVTRLNIVWRDSFRCVTKLIHTWNDSFMCTVAWSQTNHQLHIPNTIWASHSWQSSLLHTCVWKSCTRRSVTTTLRTRSPTCDSSNNKSDPSDLCVRICYNFVSRQPLGLVRVNFCSWQPSFVTTLARDDSRS